MKKPPPADFAAFAAEFQAASRRAGKQQYLVPYFIASHPGSDLDAMIELALFLKRNGYRPQQVQDFIPAPMDLATAMYYTGLDPRTLRPVAVSRQLRDRRLQRALMQFFAPENWFLVRQALELAGRKDLIGDGCDALIPAHPPRTALAARRRRAERDFGRFVHERGQRPEDRAAAGDWDAFTGYRDGESPARDTAPTPRSIGYRPHRTGARAPRRR
jgi:hypothetical protein